MFNIPRVEHTLFSDKTHKLPHGDTRDRRAAVRHVRAKNPKNKWLAWSRGSLNWSQHAQIDIETDKFAWSNVFPWHPWAAAEGGEGCPDQGLP